MKNFNEVCASLLEGVISSLRGGNNNIDEQGMEMITEAIQSATNQKQRLSTEEAIRYLRCTRVAFYDMKRSGLITGEKGKFQKTLYYTKKELDEAVSKMKEKRRGSI